MTRDFLISPQIQQGVFDRHEKREIATFQANWRSVHWVNAAARIMAITDQRLWRMTNNKLNFTKRSIGSIPNAPEGKRGDYHDSKTPGLTLRVTESGVKAFTFLRRIEGKQERLTLGRFPAMTVEQARVEAEKLNGAVAADTNPAAARRGIRQEITAEAATLQNPRRHGRAYWSGQDWRTCACTTYGAL